MVKYPKIQSVFKRDPDNMRYLLDGQFSLPEFQFLQYNDWYFTEKVNGTNIRVVFDGDKLALQGRTDKAQIPEALWHRLGERFYPQVDQFKATFPQGVCFYGEGYGPRIQKGGGKYREDQDFVLFDIKIGEWWLKRGDIEGIALQFGLDVVPIVGIGNLYTAINMIKSGLVSRWGDFEAEGVVCRPRVELQARSGNRIITKIKHRDFKREGE